MSKTKRQFEGMKPGTVPASDVVGGGAIAVLGLVHLFVLGVGGGVGVLLLLVAWPLVGGALAAAIENDRRPGRERELGLEGATAGVFGAITVGIVVLFAGVAGLWPSFVYTTFGTEIASVTIAVTMLFTISWTVFGFAGGYSVRRSIDG